MKTAKEKMTEIAMMSIFEVFEKMYYIFMEPRDGETSGIPQRAVTIRFSGAVDGEMRATYSEALASTMVENALGITADGLNDQIVEDCLKECVNMICGNFLQKMEPDRVLHLSIPHYEGKACDPRDEEDPETIRMAFEAEGMSMGVVLKIKKAMDQ